MFGWFKKEARISKLNKLFKQKKYNETIQLASNSLNEGMNAAEFYTFQIWSLLETKQMDQAKMISEQAIKTYVDHPVFLALDGEICYRLELFDRAHASLIRAMEFSPGNLQVEYLLGLNLVAQGKLEEASEYFDSILRYDPTLLQTRLLAMAEHHIYMTRKSV
jgi:tetratricopeptide (TPR) repeat protein